jgi:hypothetical protein
MELKIIFLIVLLFWLFFILLGYITSDASRLTGLMSAQNMQEIDAANLAATGTQNSSSSNFAYSIWFYIDDWNYRYGESKVIYGRMTSGSGTKEPCPSVTLTPMQNNINVAMAVYPGLDSEPAEKGNNFIVHECGISNVPIQKWCNLMISVYGRTLDIYLDGKLVRTCVLPGVAKIDGNAPVYVTPMGGFSGWTAKFQYWPESIDPQKAWNVYSDGYGVGFLATLFGKYSVKLSLYSDNTEQTSYTI